MSPEATEILVEGLGIGSIYAVVAMGFVVIYKTSPYDRYDELGRLL